MISASSFLLIIIPSVILISIREERELETFHLCSSEKENFRFKKGTAPKRLLSSLDLLPRVHHTMMRWRERVKEMEIKSHQVGLHALFSLQASPCLINFKMKESLEKLEEGGKIPLSCLKPDATER